MTTGISLLVLMVIFILTYVNSQRLIESKCSEYSQIPMNSSNPFPYIAVWSTKLTKNDEIRRYVILISDKFVLGNYMRPADSNWDSVFANPRNNKIYFTPNDVHNVIEALYNSLPDERRTRINIVHNIILMKIDRILLDSNHRPACLWARTDYVTGTVDFVQSSRFVEDIKNDASNRLFDMVLSTSTTNVSYDESFCPNVDITTTFCFESKYNESGGWEAFSPILQRFKPFNFLPNNYYVYGFMVYVDPKTSSPIYFNLPMSSRFDWIEASVWNTNAPSCGMTKLNINPVILYSEPTLSGEFPWHAAIFYVERHGQRKYKCGGTLLNENTVVTAAHCVSTPTGTLSREILLVILGNHELDIDSLDSRESKVSAIHVHNLYSRHNFESDIAVLKLRTTMSFTKYIQPICITRNLRLFENPIGVLPGWGLNEFNQLQPILAKGSYPIRSKSECRGHDGLNPVSALASFVNENNFCAGYKNGTSLCNGDSGGGLVFNVNGQWFLRGIASVGATISETGRCDPFELSLFTDVIQFYDWIVDKM